jgi:hypothetical protein
MWYSCCYCIFCGVIGLDNHFNKYCYITRNGKVFANGYLCIKCEDNKNEKFKYTDKCGELMVEIEQEELNLYELVCEPLEK